MYTCGAVCRYVCAHINAFIYVRRDVEWLTDMMSQLLTDMMSQLLQTSKTSGMFLYESKA
jgi:hypothetical protein